MKRTKYKKLAEKADRESQDQRANALWRFLDRCKRPPFANQQENIVDNRQNLEYLFATSQSKHPQTNVPEQSETNRSQHASQTKPWSTLRVSEDTKVRSDLDEKQQPRGASTFMTNTATALVPTRAINDLSTQHKHRRNAVSQIDDDEQEALGDYIMVQHIEKCLARYNLV